MRKLKPIHPGEILREEFMQPLELNANRLALNLHVPAPTVYEIIREKRDISPQMALRLGRYFRTTPEFWMNLQTRYNLEMARDKQQRTVKQQVQPRRIAAHAG
jgi:antitoxin HigA-1